MKNIPLKYHAKIRQMIKKAREDEREKCLLRLEACLFGTYDVKNLDVEPPTLEKATIKTIQDHIQMHINLIKKEL